jgi:hypothetical protein
MLSRLQHVRYGLQVRTDPSYGRRQRHNRHSWPFDDQCPRRSYCRYCDYMLFLDT